MSILAFQIHWGHQVKEDRHHQQRSSFLQLLPSLGVILVF